MVPVELVEAPGPEGPPEERSGARPRAGHRLTLLLVGALVVALVAADARERERPAPTHVPGFLFPVEDGLPPRWEVDAATAPALWRGALVGTTLVGPTSDGRVVGLDVTSGAELWATAVDVNPLLCRAAGALVVCLRAPFLGTGGTSPRSRPVLGLPAVVLDPADGHVVRTVDPPGGVGAFVAGDVLVTTALFQEPDWEGSTRTEERLRAEALDPASGAAVWTRVSASLDPAATSTEVAAIGGTTVLRLRDTALLIGADGAEQGSVSTSGEAGLVATRSGGLFRYTSLAGDVMSELRLPDGSWVPAGGRLLWLAADDGSAPGAVFVVADNAAGAASSVSALDDGTGEVEWTTEVPAGAAALVGGLLVLATPGGLTALDAVTGEVAWTAATERDVGEVVTDGRLVLVRRADLGVEAFALATGERAWRADLLPLVSSPADWGPGAVLRFSGTTGLAWVERRDGTALVVG